MNVTFKNLDNKNIQNCFMEVLREYESLNNYEIVLEYKPIKGSTMQAQPIIDWSSFKDGISRYKVELAIYVRDSQDLRVDELPKEVLKGWFAHELGHVVDYAPYSTWQMAKYGIKYLLFDDFKKEVEHKADYIAIQNGFREEIIATKKFLLEHDLMSEEYKAKIRKYYMPLEEVLTWDHKHVPGTPVPGS